jgi:hypothetical protein
MAIRRWMFFHPNDGTRPYPDLNPEVNQPLWERIQDQDDTIERLHRVVDNLNHQLEQYQGRVLGNSQLVQSETILDMSQIPYGDEQRIREQHINQQIQNMVVELRNNDLVEVTFQRSDWNESEVRLRTRMRIVPPNNI